MHVLRLLLKALIFIKIQMYANRKITCLFFQGTDFSLCSGFWAVSPCQTSVSGGSVRRPD